MKFDSSSRVPHKFDVYECQVFGSRINKDCTINEPNNISKHILEVVFVGYVARRWEIEEFIMLRNLRVGNLILLFFNEKAFVPHRWSKEK